MILRGFKSSACSLERRWGLLVGGDEFGDLFDDDEARGDGGFDHAGSVDEDGDEEEGGQGQDEEGEDADVFGFGVFVFAQFCGVTEEADSVDQEEEGDGGKDGDPDGGGSEVPSDDFVGDERCFTFDEPDGCVSFLTCPFEQGVEVCGDAFELIGGGHDGLL